MIKLNREVITSFVRRVKSLQSTYSSLIVDQEFGDHVDSLLQDYVFLQRNAGSLFERGNALSDQVSQAARLIYQRVRFSFG